MDDLTPAEHAAVDRFDAASRDFTASMQNFTLAAIGTARRLDELVRTLLEQEQREFIRITAEY